MAREGKTVWLTAGALIGALLGLGVAYTLWQQYEEQGRRPQLDARRGLRLALTLLQSVRKVTSLFEAE